MTIFIILAITFVPIVASYLYFRKEKETCQKYPFFALRDKIVWELIKSENSTELQDCYRRVNLIAQKLKELNFGFLFFMEIMTIVLSRLIENKYREALKKPLVQHCSLELNKFERELATLIIDAARKNSVLLRFAMTHMGFYFLFFPLWIRAKNRFFENNSYLFENRKSRIKTIQQYSVLAHCI
jgi:hypothetical protein